MQILKFLKFLFFKKNKKLFLISRPKIDKITKTIKIQNKLKMAKY